MKKLIALMAATLLAASLALGQLSSVSMTGLIGSLQENALSEWCVQCAHIVVFLALLLEAWAVWRHAPHDEKPQVLKTVSIMFVTAAIMGLSSVTISVLPLVAPISVV